MDVDQVKQIAVDELAFDTRNPRLLEFGVGNNTTEREIIRILWRTMDVEELVLSIAANGFFRHEPIIVALEDGKHVVIEGNRRLAAVKVLRSPGVIGKLGTVPTVAPGTRASLDTIPAIYATRENAWRYLGFKHVNGPAKWTSYAKSRYIADVHRKFGIPLRDIAEQIGDTHRTVQRLFRGLMVLEQAEHMKVFDRDDRWRTRFAFSHLYTGLGYTGISAFIGADGDDESQHPIPSEKKEELRELCLWLYGSRQEDARPVVERQNPHLRQLDAVVGSKQALAALRSGAHIEAAYETSRPSSKVFEAALFEAKSSLQKAKGMLSSGYSGSEELLRAAGTIANLAGDLYDEMERKYRPNRKPRITEED